MPLILALLALLRWLTAASSGRFRFQLPALAAGSRGRFHVQVNGRLPLPAPARRRGRLQLQVNGRFQRPVPAAGSTQPQVTTPFIRLSRVIDFTVGALLLAVFLALAVLFPSD